MLNLYKFYVFCGRAGNLKGLFAAEQEEVEAVFGKDLFFGEVLGKHSDVTVSFGPEDITKIDVDHSTVCTLIDAFGTNSFCGFNPLDQYNDQVEDGIYDDGNEE